jgi:hypothetical protein
MMLLKNPLASQSPLSPPRDFHHYRVRATEEKNVEVEVTRVGFRLPLRHPKVYMGAAAVRTADSTGFFTVSMNPNRVLVPEEIIPFL